MFAHIAGLPQPVLERFKLLFFNRGARVVAVESLDKRRWLGNQLREVQNESLSPNAQVCLDPGA